MTAVSAHEDQQAARTKTAERLLKSSARNSYDPLLDIDWDAPVETWTWRTCRSSACRCTAPNCGTA